ncbi:MAG: tetratricopeptide repeat protein [Bacteroidota bacterium]
MRILLFLLALAIGLGDDGSKSGRKGNELYRNAEHEKAASLFSTGIAEQNTSEPGTVHAGLWNNLGASLHRMGRYDEARQAFGNAVSLAPSNLEIARSSYNAGNNAFEAYQQASQQQIGGMAPPPGAAQQPGQQPPGQQSPGQQGPAPELEGMQGALEHYKRAMLADPMNEDAKFNYEFVKRQLENQEQNQDQQQEQDQNNQDQENNENQDQQQQNQDQQNQEQNQDQQQQQNQDSQQQEENQEQQQQQQNEQQQQQPPPDPNKLSKEEAERILQALQNEEEELLRQVMKSQSRPKKVEKDW